MVLYSESGSNLLLWSFDLLSLNLFWEISRKIVVVDINKDRLFKKPYLLILAFRDSNKQDRVMSFSCLLRAELTTGYGTNTVVFVKVQFSLSVVSDSATPWTIACQASLSIANSQSPPKPMSIESVMPSRHLTLCRPLLLLPSIFPNTRVFSNESTLRIRWPKYQGFSFSISPSSEHPGLISFRMDWLDLLAVEETLKSLLQHHSSKASILRCSAFFIVRPSDPYMTTGKTIAFTRRNLVGKVMSLLLNMLSRLVITFLPRSKCLNFMSAITICSKFGAQKNKVSHCFHCFPIYLPWSDGTRYHDLSFLNVEL